MTSLSDQALALRRARDDSEFLPLHKSFWLDASIKTGMENQTCLCRERVKPQLLISHIETVALHPEIC